MRLGIGWIWLVTGLNFEEKVKPLKYLKCEGLSHFSQSSLDLFFVAVVFVLFLIISFINMIIYRYCQMSFQ